MNLKPYFQQYTFSDNCAEEQYFFFFFIIIWRTIILTILNLPQYTAFSKHIVETFL